MTDNELQRTVVGQYPNRTPKYGLTLNAQNPA
jgi:hypothetical protein